MGTETFRLRSFRPRLEALETRATPSTSNWVPVNSGTTANLHDVSGISDDSLIFAVGDGGTILRSTDDGVTWPARPSGTTANLFGIGGGLRDYVVGAGGTILHTSDKGDTWLPILSGTSETLHAIDQFDNGFVAVGDHGTILHSANGTSWTPGSSGTTVNLLSVFGGFGGTALIAVGDNGTILRSADGGTTWNPQNSGTTLTLRDGIDQGTFGEFVVGDDFVLHSTDQGATWTAIFGGFFPTFSDPTPLHGITGDDSGNLWAVGRGIEVSTDQGASWRFQASNAGQLDAVWANTSTDVFAVGAAGTILRFEGIKLTATGSDFGSLPEVRVFDSQTGALVRDFMAYDQSFRGGVRVAMGDVNLDGTDDIITSPGPSGGPHIKVFDGKSGNLIEQFFAYDSAFTGGVFVAYGLQASTHGTMPFIRSEIITGADAGGGPHVKVFDGTTSATIASFFAYDAAFTGGVRVTTRPAAASGAAPEIVTGAGPGGGPHVKVFDNSGNVLQSFFAYDPDFRGGVFVASSGRDIVTGAAASGGPHVRVFDEHSRIVNEFFAYDASFLGGVRVSVVGDIDGDNIPDIITTPGPSGGPNVRYFQGGSNGRLINAYDANFVGGVFVAGSVRGLVEAP